MGRQPLSRRVGFIPQVTSFTPQGVHASAEVRLTIEELEAIRLKEIEELELEECAIEMNVSRTTFSRILDSARKNIADALLNGKAIIIEGGNFEVAAIRKFHCPKGHKWYISGEHIIKNVPENCPRRKTSHSEVMQSCDRICDEMRFRRQGKLRSDINR
ncbi:MAG: DUF134 domain-containing protein [Dehalococcoidales bacterium]|jgi:predicted DNA-binding protein (UPF0251 family)|nr:DUF134 domain-containing protein [Dehalococcoidales bacterium]